MIKCSNVLKNKKINTFFFSFSFEGEQINSKGRILNVSVFHSLLQAVELMQKYLVHKFSSAISKVKNTLYLLLNWIIPQVYPYIFAQDSHLGGSSNVRAVSQCKWKAAYPSDIQKVP